MYLANYSRPDIAYAIGRLSQLIYSSNQDHWVSIHIVHKYLKDTIVI